MQSSIFVYLLLNHVSAFSIYGLCDCCLITGYQAIPFAIITGATRIHLTVDNEHVTPTGQNTPADTHVFRNHFATSFSFWPSWKSCWKCQNVLNDHQCTVSICRNHPRGMWLRGSAVLYWAHHERSFNNAATKQKKRKGRNCFFTKSFTFENKPQQQELVFEEKKQTLE